jgi:catechol 2,3-dioxygenase-like lactoylglutathione lyase family enzyme
MTTVHRLTHIGLCVSDIDRSIEFYCRALGFTEKARMKVDDDATGTLLDVPGLALDLVYLERDGFRLELLGYTAPGTQSTDAPRQMNKVGFTHLSFRVDDPDLLVAAIVEHGGRLLVERTVTFEGANRGLMLMDPDGNLLELIERLSNKES